MLHDYTTTIPKCYKEVFAISFFEIAARPNNYFLVHCFRWNVQTYYIFSSYLINSLRSSGGNFLQN